MTALVPVNAADLANADAQTAALARLEEVKRQIPTADADTLAQMRAWAAALDAMAQMRAARDVAIEACVVQILTERQLGKILPKRKPFPTAHFPVPQHVLRVCQKLAAIPDDTFELTLEHVRYHSRSFTGGHFYRVSR